MLITVTAIVMIVEIIALIIVVGVALTVRGKRIKT